MNQPNAICPKCERIIYADTGEESINCPECGKPIYVPRAIILFEDAYPTKGEEDYERPETVAPPVRGEKRNAQGAQKPRTDAPIKKSASQKAAAPKAESPITKKTEASDTQTGEVTVILKHSASPFSPADGSSYVLSFGGTGVKLVSGKGDSTASLKVKASTYVVRASVYGYEDKACRKAPVWESKSITVRVESGRRTVIEIQPGRFFNAPTLTAREG